MEQKQNAEASQLCPSGGLCRTNQTQTDRSRELRSRTKGTLLAHELFSAMPPWEILKVLLGLLVSDNVSGAEGEELEMAIFDISRAHFMAPMDREACIKLPQEDKLAEDGDAVGLLLRSMHGFRTASANWMRDLQTTLEQGDHKVGVANPALFHRSDDGSRGGVHRDDFADGQDLVLVSIPCESRTDLALEVTVNVMPSC